jgi:hypothetical protein
MRLLHITEEEAKMIVKTLMHTWVPIDDQKTLSDLIIRLEKELEELQ